MIGLAIQAHDNCCYFTIYHNPSSVVMKVLAPSGPVSFNVAFWLLPPMCRLKSKKLQHTLSVFTNSTRASSMASVPGNLKTKPSFSSCFSRRVCLKCVRTVFFLSRSSCEVRLQRNGCVLFCFFIALRFLCLQGRFIIKGYHTGIRSFGLEQFQR
jgi:hypothetical protein